MGFVVNPRAGVRKKAYQDVKDIAASVFNGNHHVEVHLTKDAKDATQLARYFVQDGYDTVVSVGGDGTINATAKALMGTETALGVLPYGSGNGLARGLSIPLNIGDAIRAVAAGHTKRIDSGEVSVGDQKKYFFGFAGIGYDAFVGRLFNQRKGRRGLFTYVYLSLAAFRSFEPVAVKVRFNEREIYARPFILAIANTNQYGNGAKIAPYAVPDDGLLEVCLLQEMTFTKGLVHGWRLFNGTIDRMANTSMYRSRIIEVSPDGPIYYHLDGEPFETAERLRFSVIPSNLKVVVGP